MDPLRPLDLAVEDGRLVTHLPVRWGDLDPYRHVNNVAVIGLLEEARVVALWRLGRAGELPSNAIEGGTEAPIQTYIVHTEIAYRRPLRYTGAPVRVEIWFSHLGAADVEVAYEIREPGTDGSGPTAVLATTTLAVVDAATARPRRLPASVREAWTPLVGERPAFRSRRR